MSRRGGSSSSSSSPNEDVYDFDGSNQTTANQLIGATVTRLGNKGVGGPSSPNGQSDDAPLTPGSSGSDMPRPMTSVKGAGYSSRGTSGGRPAFDPLGRPDDPSLAPPLVSKTTDSAEAAAKDIEKAVNRLLEESSTSLFMDRDKAKALEKAKEAGKKERLLNRHREKNGLGDQQNHELTFAVVFNLANLYAHNGMYQEALNSYSIMVKNKQYPQWGRLRVNMGNIYFHQKQYPQAIKMYRMAMDQVGNLSREMKYKIMRNIGIAFLRMGQFQDAIHSFEAVMEQQPDPQTGFNLIICYYALGDREKMKKGFQSLLTVPEYLQESEEENEIEMDYIASLSGDEKKGGHGSDDVKLKEEDELHKDRKERKKITHRYLHMAARLIAPHVEKTLEKGFDWVIEQLRQPIDREKAQNLSSSTSMNPLAASQSALKPGFPTLAMEMEIAKGIAFMKKKQLDKAIDVFKSFEKNDSALIDQASTNLSFLYFLEGDYKNADKYAEMAVKADRYNAKALVNKANVLFQRGELDAAKELYLEAIGVEADCIEAIYNLGLCNKRMSQYHDAIAAFKKLYRIMPKDLQVIWQLGNLFDLIGDVQQAAQLFTTLHSLLPSDPKILSRLGSIYAKENDETSAYHNYHDSYNIYPVAMDVITWLAVWNMKQGMYEEAAPYFQRAAEIEPHEMKWQLMIASCYRHMGQEDKALHLYKVIHQRDVDNPEPLKFIVQIVKGRGKSDEYEKWMKVWKKAEKAAQQKGEEENAAVAEGADVDPTGGKPRGAIASKKGRDDPGFDGSELHPTKEGPTINKGKGGGANDEWGDDGLGDELLPL